MRYIITGGTGLIGKALANSLASDGHEVIVLTRNVNKPSNGLDKRVTLAAWDGKSADGWGHWMDGANVVVNLAGESIAGEGFPPSRWTAERKRRIQDSRVNAGRALVAAIRAAANKPAVLVQSSAVGYYGVHGDEAIADNHPAGNDFLAQTCQTWEASTSEVEALGVRRVIVRTGVVLSSTGGALPLMALPFKLFAGGPIGNGKQQVPWIHLADEVAALRFVADNPNATGAYNLSAPNPLSNAAFGKALGAALNRPSLIPTPAFVFQLMFGEMATILLDGQRAVPERLLKEGFTFQFTDAGAALRDLFQNGR